jgi:hypothetical protein
MQCLRSEPETSSFMHSVYAAIEVACLDKYFILYPTIQYMIYTMSRLHSGAGNESHENEAGRSDAILYNLRHYA